MIGVLQILKTLLTDYGPSAVLGFFLGLTINKLIGKNNPTFTIDDIKRAVAAVLMDDRAQRRETKRHYLNELVPLAIIKMFTDFCYQSAFDTMDEQAIELLLMQSIETYRDIINNYDPDLKLGTLIFDRLGDTIRIHTIKLYREHKGERERYKIMMDMAKSFANMAQNITRTILS